MSFRNFESSLLLNFIKTIDSHLIEEIFHSPFTCSVIFRELSNLSKHIISRILFIDETVRKSLIASWVNKDYSTMLESSLTELNDLRVFISVSNGPQGECMRLNRKFQENLKFALFGGKTCNLVREYNDSSYKLEPIESLTQNTAYKWETVLSMVAGINDKSTGNSIVRQVIMNAGYVKNDEITNEGFQFLLLQKKKQVWQFLISYLESMKNPTVIIEILTLLFQIGYGTVNQVYICTNPSLAQQDMLQHFLEFGFIHSNFKQMKGLNCMFQPTPLLIDLLSGHDRISLEEDLDQSSSIISSQGYIIMETSDLIYAVTASKLQTAVLGMFCNVKKKFPYAVLFHITDQSIFRALNKGITSDQIIAFLRNNAHPQMKHNDVVPITLVDKIKIVEFSRNRTRPIMGYLYHSFSSTSEFDTLVSFAEPKNAIAWKNREKLMVMVFEDSHSMIRKFWKNRKNSEYS